MSFKCRKCGAELPDEAGYCPSCGEKQFRPDPAGKLSSWITGKPKQALLAAVIVALAAVGLSRLPSGQSAASVSGSGSDTVWVSESGNTYHSKSDCSKLKDPKQITLKEAEEQGYEQCETCY